MSTTKGARMQENAVSSGSQKPDSIGLRLPAGVKDRIRVVATKDRRTITSWVEKLIFDALEEAESRKAS